MIFLTVKAFQELSQISPPPLPPQRSNGPPVTSSFFRCETFFGSSTAGFIKQKIKLMWPNALFLRFVQKSCSCPVVFEGVKEQVQFVCSNTLPSLFLFVVPVNNCADEKFFENSFFLFSHLLSRWDVSQENNISDTV